MSSIKEYVDRNPDMLYFVAMQLSIYEEAYGEGVCAYEIAESKEESAAIFNKAKEHGYTLVDENMFGHGTKSASILIFKKVE